MSNVNLNIDGHAVAVPKGTLIVEAARQIGIEIPVYCYHPKMAPVGACRVCVVNVEGQRNPIMPACATEVAEGMVVHTRNELATKAREGVLELLLINHPLDCPVCDRGGECDLQDFTVRYGPSKSRFEEEKRHFAKSIRVGKEVVLDRERCILCMRCTRFCHEIAMEEGLTIIERGTRSEIGPFPGRSFDSQFSGNTVEICPVGALTSENYRFKSRPWELQNFASVCTNCSVGCNITADVRYDHVVRVRSRCNDKIDDGWLCDKGRYGFGFVNSAERITRPLVRKGGQLEAVSWDEALAAAAAGLKAAGTDVGAVAGPRLSNEGGWQLLRLVRSALNSPNLDHRHGLTVPKGTATIASLDTASAVVVVHSNPTRQQPVLDLRIKKALRKGAQLIVVSSEAIELDEYADVRVNDLQALIGTVRDAEVPVHEGLHYPAPRPWEPGGKTSTDLAEAAKSIKRTKKVVIITDERATPEQMEQILKLVEVSGAEAPHGLLIGLMGANSQGLREMGVLPEVPSGLGGQAWGNFSAAKGKTAREMLDGGVKALLLVAEDELQQKPGFLVVLDVNRNTVTDQADVVLPAASFLEQAMTMTSMDGTLQLCRQALPPKGESLPDYVILTRLAAALGQIWSTVGASKIFAEIGLVNPLYQGSSYAQFQSAAEVHWSYPQQGRLGTPRPDLSAMPVYSADDAPWTTAVSTGSRVENVARALYGGVPPAVPGQEDPRKVASRMSLLRVITDSPQAVLEPPHSEGRVQADRAAQSPGPSPANRHHHLGQPHRDMPLGATPLPTPVKEPDSPGQEAAAAGAAAEGKPK
jgi:NADH-quinone oxidoreductase subunit G